MDSINNTIIAEEMLSSDQLEKFERDFADKNLSAIIVKNQQQIERSDTAYTVSCIMYDISGLLQELSHEADSTMRSIKKDQMLNHLENLKIQVVCL